MITPGATFNYPSVLRRIEVQLVYNRQAGIRYTGTLFLDNLRVGYPQSFPTWVERDSLFLPNDFVLSQNYPNPFNPSTTIRFEIAAAGMTTLKVYDVMGREARTLVNKELEAGAYSATFDASNLPSGTYLYVLQSGAQRLTGKMLLLK